MEETKQKQYTVRKTVKTGITFDSALAMVSAMSTGTLWDGQFSMGCSVGFMSSTLY